MEYISIIAPACVIHRKPDTMLATKRCGVYGVWSVGELTRLSSQSRASSFRHSSRYVVGQHSSFGETGDFGTHIILGIAVAEDAVGESEGRIVHGNHTAFVLTVRKPEIVVCKPINQLQVL